MISLFAASWHFANDAKTLTLAAEIGFAALIYRATVLNQMRTVAFPIFVFAVATTVIAHRGFTPGFLEYAFAALTLVFQALPRPRKRQSPYTRQCR